MMGFLRAPSGARVFFRRHPPPVRNHPLRFAETRAVESVRDQSQITREITPEIT
jgi:hypothetical protein